MRPSTLGAIFVVASIGAGFGSLYLIRYLTRHRGRSGAIWFIGNLTSVALFCFSYGLSLLVSNPTLRMAFEMLTFASLCFMGPFFLAFGLEYTGRSDLIRKPLFAIVAIVPVVTTGLVVTNPLHGLVWTEFRFAPVFGLETVQYTVQPWGVFAILFCIGTAAIGSLALIGAIVSYGPLYRREATAVVLSTIPPTVGVSWWLFELGPVPQLHLTAALMLIHISLDTFAFVGTHMFETNPATQRAAERSGLDNLTEPVIVLDTEHYVVRLNDSAEVAFGNTMEGPLPMPLSQLTGLELATLVQAGELEADGRTFGVSYTPLTDPADDPVGGMIVCYDLTRERQREQQLAVLNRVLRHNLRNEMTVIQGLASSLHADLEDPTYASQAATIVEASSALLSIGEKAREFDRLLDRELQTESVDVTAVVSDIQQEFTKRYPEATVGVEVDVDVGSSSPCLRTNPDVLSFMLSNLLENAIEHATERSAVYVHVHVAESADGRLRVAIRDTNERIPESETTILREGTETALQHGQGIGLWVVNWCLEALNGEIEFAYDNGNVVTLLLPTEATAGDASPANVDGTPARVQQAESVWDEFA